ncbi:MAG: F0F1 ATP synthase subunit B [Methylococcales bacterium]
MSINATLIGQMITFALLVWFTMKFVWPPILQALEERKKQIADGLAAGEDGEKKLELARERVKAVLKEAKTEAADIVGKAQKRAGDLIDQSKETAKTEGDRMISAAKADIEQEVKRTKEDLRKQVSVLAVSAAEQILQKEVDKTKHQSVLDTVSKQLG